MIGRRRGRSAKAVPAGLISLGFVVALSGCTAPGQPTTSVSPSVSAFTSSVTSQQSSTSPSPSSPSSVGNFALGQDFPDPAVVLDGDKAYAFATNVPNTNIQVATASSSDLRSWHVEDTDALPQLPTWALAGNTWAPDVAKVGDHYVMYFVARSLAAGLQCIGVATASTPGGPYRSAATLPLICPQAEGGAIDPSFFRDGNGRTYLVWKNDGNCCGLDTWLQLQPLSPDGLTTVGRAKKLLKQNLAWEGSLIEAPQLVHHGGTYSLFYSANDYSTDAYAIGYATSASLTGPYRKPAQPLLTSSSFDNAYHGPGGQEVLQTPDRKWHLLFHSWDASHAFRGLNVVNLTWRNSTPELESVG